MPRRRVIQMLLTVCLLLLALFGVPVAAWEEDVHYTLTFWLATQAGFSRNDADQIAKGDQSYDESEHTSAIPTVLWIILSNDTGAARDLQLKHFPTDAPLPSPPLRRVVSPNSPIARRAVEAALNAGDSSTTLTTLGEAFHPFQDSWSHQGVPDIPYNLRSNLISAHPQLRGGWKSHNADLTHLHVEETVDVARETYRFLTRFVMQNPQFRRNAPAAWTAIEPTVRAFARAQTVAEKAAWATQYVPEETRPSRAAANPGRRLRIRPLSPPLTNSRSGFTALAAAEQAALLKASGDFLRLWLVQRDVDSALRFVDLNEAAGQFSDDQALSNPSAIANWCGKFLTIQLIDDHSAVNDAGHGEPSHPRYQELPRRPTETGPFKATRKADSVNVSGRNFFRTDLVGSPALAMVFLNEDVVHDALTLVWKQVGSDWVIVRLMAIPH